MFELVGFASGSSVPPPTERRSAISRSRLLQAGLFAVGYFALARLGLLLVAKPAGIAAFWPAAGFALAIFLVSPRRNWALLAAGLMASSFAANLIDGFTAFTSLGFAGANAAQAVLAATLLLRFTRRPAALGGVRQVLVFVGVAVIGANAAVALLAAAVPALAFDAPYWDSWLRWWAADGVGILVAAPATLMLAGAIPRRRLGVPRRLEAGALTLGLVLVSLVLFGASSSAATPFFDFPYPLLPLLIWAGVRFGVAGVGLAGLPPAVAGTALTLAHRGPFADPANPISTQILQFQGFLLMALTTALVLAAIATERESARRALAESLRRTRGILENANDAFVSIDAAGIITDWNRQAERTFGWSREDAVGRALTETIMPERFADAHRAGLGHFLETGEEKVVGRPIELSAMCRDGSEIPVELTISPLRLDDDTWVFNAFIRNITERKQTQAALQLEEEAARARETALSEAQRVAHVGSWEWDIPGDRVSWSDELYRIYGLDRDEFPASFKGFLERVHPDERTRVRGLIERSLDTTDPFKFTHRLVRADGSIGTVESRGHVILGDDGAPARMAGTCQDVTEQHQAEEALREAEERFRRAFEDAGTGMALVGVDGDEDDRFLDVNRALCEMTGYPRAELMRMNYRGLTHPDDLAKSMDGLERLAAGEIPSFQVEKRILDANGEAVWVSASTSYVHGPDGAPLYRVAQLQDVTERKRSEGQLQYLVDHDPLTGLFNRRRFESELSRELVAAGRYGRGGAVLVLDLDDFKYVNDSLGHAAGDELIGCVGRVMRARLRDSDILGRLGGDEFAVILPHADEAAARAVAGTLREAIGRANDGASAGSTTASIGITLFPEGPGATSGEEALIEADVAMYDAKEGGRDRIAVYDPEAGRRQRHEVRFTWLERIRAALDGDRFVLHAQPIVSLRDGAGPERFELLVRMLSDDGDVIPPGTFLYIAEQFDLIQDIDRWVLRKAIRQIAEHGRSAGDACFHVNLSSKSIVDPELPELIAHELAVTGADPRLLVFEMTETEAIVNVDRAKQFAATIHELGCRFALDDFGAGFASFHYLKHLSFDYLKIDGEFIEDLPGDKTNQLLVRSVVEIARGLGKETVAEYVGDQATLELVREYGVDFAQGFHLGKPRPLLASDAGAAIAART